MQPKKRGRIANPLSNPPTDDHARLKKLNAVSRTLETARDLMSQAPEKIEHCQDLGDVVAWILANGNLDARVTPSQIQLIKGFIPRK